MTMLLSTPERQEQLQQLIEQQHRISVAQICQHFSISEATARRDLDTLVDKGVIRRVHGGAIAIHRAPPEPSVLQRSAEQTELKERIGQLAATLIGSNETVFLGSGTTVLEVARNLHNCEKLTVVTNSLPVMNMLSDKPGVSLIGLGGVFRPEELSFIGHITIQALAELRIDKVVMGIRAMDSDEGLTNDYMPETTTARAILEAGRQVIMVADHTKFARVSVAFVAPVTVVDILVSDADMAPKLRADFATKGIRVLTA